MRGSPSPDRLTLAAFATLLTIGGLSTIAIRAGSGELPPFWGAFLRFGLAALLLLAVVGAARLPIAGGRTLAGAALFGVLGFAASYALFYRGIVDVPAGLAQVLMSLIPLFTLLFAVAHRVEAFTARALAGTVLATAGIVVVSAEQLSLAVPLASVLAIIGAAACAAEAGVLVKAFPRAHIVTFNAVAMGVGAALLLVFSILANEAMVIPERITTLLSLAYLIPVGSIGIFLLYVFVLQRWTASATSYMFVLLPFVTVAIGVLFGGERLSGPLVFGALLVLLGVYVVALSHGTPRTGAAAPGLAKASPLGGGVRVPNGRQPARLDKGPANRLPRSPLHCAAAWRLVVLHCVVTLSGAARPGALDRQIDPGEARHLMRPAGAVAEAAGAFNGSVAANLCGLTADAGRAGGRGHAPVLRADALADQVTLVRVEMRPGIRHQGAPLGRVIPTTTSTDGAPPSVNNVSEKYSSEFASMQRSWLDPLQPDASSLAHNHRYYEVSRLSRRASLASPASAVHDALRRPVAAAQRRRGAIVTLRMAERDCADRRDVIRHAEGGAETPMVGDAEEQRAETRIDRTEEDEHRGHRGVDVPVRHRPALLVHVGPALVRLGVAVQVHLLLREADDDRWRAEEVRPAERGAPLRRPARVPEPRGLLGALEDEERPTLAEAGRGRALRVGQDLIEDRLCYRPVLEAADHAALADDVLEFHGRASLARVTHRRRERRRRSPMRRSIALAAVLPRMVG